MYSKIGSNLLFIFIQSQPNLKITDVFNFLSTKCNFLALISAMYQHTFGSVNVVRYKRFIQLIANLRTSASRGGYTHTCFEYRRISEI